MTAYLGVGCGPWEMGVILLIAMLLFGHRIPGMARSLGSGIVEFKKGLKGGSDGSSTTTTTTTPPEEPPAQQPPAQQGQTPNTPNDQGSASN